MSDPAEQNELIANWLAVNPGSEEQARFYLEANNWDLNAALSNFYEEPPLSEGLPMQHQGDPALPLDPNLIPSGHGSYMPTAAPVVSAGPEYAVSVEPGAPSTPSTSVPRRRYGPGARIATLSSLGGHDDGDNDESDSQEWYAGGERSGMAIRPPAKDPADTDGGSLVDRILRRAAEGSAAAGPSSQPENAPQPQSFVGRGRKLGSPSSSAADPAHDAESSDSDISEGGRSNSDDVAVRELTFWRNGFSLGDGPLFNTEDPVNRQNLEAILQGRAPLDILNVRPGQQVEMKVTNRRDEDYVPPPPPPAQPFSGHGQRLGGLAPAISAAAALSSAGTNPQSAVGRPIVLDQSQPIVQVQIRLADSTRLVARVNPSHTIGDLRAFVLSERPEAGQRPFAFKAIMPPKILDDDLATIAQAGIASAAIAQFFT